jgi:hypothetical protein
MHAGFVAPPFPKDSSLSALDRAEIRIDQKEIAALLESRLVHD